MCHQHWHSCSSFCFKEKENKRVEKYCWRSAGSKFQKSLMFDWSQDFLPKKYLEIYHNKRTTTQMGHCVLLLLLFESPLQLESSTPLWFFQTKHMSQGKKKKKRVCHSPGSKSFLFLSHSRETVGRPWQCGRKHVDVDSWEQQQATVCGTTWQIRCFQTSRSKKTNLKSYSFQGSHIMNEIIQPDSKLCVKLHRIRLPDNLPYVDRFWMRNCFVL